MAKQPNETFGALLLGVAAGLGIASLIDLAGRSTYRNLQAAMPKPRPWTVSEALQSATKTLDETRIRAGHQAVSA